VGFYTGGGLMIGKLRYENCNGNYLNFTKSTKIVTVIISILVTTTIVCFNLLNNYSDTDHIYARSAVSSVAICRFIRVMREQKVPSMCGVFFDLYCVSPPSFIAGLNIFVKLKKSICQNIFDYFL
jgi:hypothetical protein